MRRIGTWTAAAVLGAGLLAGCSGNDTEEYCDAVKAADKKIDGLDEADPKALDEMFSTAEDLGEKAPDEVADDWKKVNEGIEELRAALEDAGVSLADLQGGQPPADADPQKLAELGKKFQDFGAEFEASSEEISQHAKDECGVDFGS